MLVEHPQGEHRGKLALWRRGRGRGRKGDAHLEPISWFVPYNNAPTMQLHQFVRQGIGIENRKAHLAKKGSNRALSAGDPTG